MSSTATSLEELNQKIKSKGDEIRQLKADGIGKEDLAPHVEELLALKAQLPDDNNKESSTNKPPKKQKNQSQPKKQPQSPKEAELSESELRQARLDKVAAMREAGIEPFDYSYQITTTAAALAEAYKDKLEPGEEDEAADVSIAGRIMMRRVFGKLAFFTLQDETGIIQLQLDKGRLGDSFKVCMFL
jgi:Skp family chaperone for outer membrane proteins